MTFLPKDTSTQPSLCVAARGGDPKTLALYNVVGSGEKFVGVGVVDGVLIAMRAPHPKAV